MNLDLGLKKIQKKSGPERQQRSRTNRSLFFLIFVLLISFTIYIPPEKTIEENDLKVGDVSKVDVLVKRNMIVEDKDATEMNRKKALENAIPIYEVNQKKSNRSEEMINSWFEFIRTERREFFRKNKKIEVITETIKKQFGFSLSNEEIGLILNGKVFHFIDLDKLLGLIKKCYEKGVIGSKIGIPTGREEAIAVVQDGDRRQITRPDSYLSLKDVENELANYLKSLAMMPMAREIALQILMEFVTPNIEYSKILSREEEENIESQVNPIYVQLVNGKYILKKGEEISPEHLKLIKMISAEEKNERKGLSEMYLTLTVVIFLLIFFWKFYNLQSIGGLNRNKVTTVISMTLFLSALIYRLSLFLFPLILRNINLQIELDTKNILFAIPFGTGALVVAFLFDLPSALIFSLINTIIGGIVCEWNFKIALFVFLGNLAASFGIEYYQRLKRSPILKVGFFWLIPTNIIMVVAIHSVAEPLTLIRVVYFVLVAIFSAVLSSFIANFIIPLWEVLFKLVTDLKLVEITNLNLPVFREMLEKAPGTYHHCQMVATLAESSAQQLGLSPLLLRAMALYHDIGKTDAPQIFTENHAIYDDPHPQLSPLESAKLIISHIANGIERAEQLKLPKQVSQIITQHHGTKLVKYFFEKAKTLSKNAESEPDENVFRYPGQKPQQIAAAIIMLADQVEAASKSLSSPTDEEIRNVIETLVNTNITENQFDECEGLTFKSLKIIANSFYEKLESIYHQRIPYPGFNFKKKESNRDQNYH